jgi:hypothetical protein
MREAPEARQSLNQSESANNSAPASVTKILPADLTKILSTATRVAVAMNEIAFFRGRVRCLSRSRRVL